MLGLEEQTSALVALMISRLKIKMGSSLARMVWGILDKSISRPTQSKLLFFWTALSNLSWNFNWHQPRFRSLLLRLPALLFLFLSEPPYHQWLLCFLLVGE